MATQPFFVPSKEIDLIDELNEELIPGKAYWLRAIAVGEIIVTTDW